MKKKNTIILIMVIISAIIFALIGFSIQSSSMDETKELQLLQVIMRHGIRTPADTYPNDPYINHTFYPVGWGQITNKGKLELYNTGKFLRERYNKFLGKFYTPNIYYTQTTDVDRTKTTAQLINAGLWPPIDDDQKWGPLNWQPIPVHSEPLNQDSLLLVRQPCPQYQKQYERVVASDEIQQKLKEADNIFKELTQITGKPVQNFDDVQDIFSTLLAEETFGLQLPNWTIKYYPEPMKSLTIFSYILNAYNSQLCRLKGGVLLKKLLNDWQLKRTDRLRPSERKFFYYVGHDSTIVNLLQTLQIWDPQLPHYGIMIIIEFSKDKLTNQYGIEVFLRNTTDLPPYQLQIPNCEKFCTLDKLIQLTENVIPTDWYDECKSDDENYTVPPQKGP